MNSYFWYCLEVVVKTLAILEGVEPGDLQQVDLQLIAIYDALDARFTDRVIAYQPFVLEDAHLSPDYALDDFLFIMVYDVLEIK